MQVKQNVNIHNRFDVHVDNIETGEHQEFTGYNIILNQMWDRLCAGYDYFNNINFGTGTGTPLASGTSLFTHLGTKSATADETVRAFPISRIKQKIVLSPEEYVGQNIREVGIAYDSNSSSLVTHAMLKDAEGNPISIVKKETDVITIFATIFVTFDMSNPALIFEPPATNSLVDYLVGLSSAPIGSFGLNEMVSSFDRLGSTVNVTWVADAPNKKRKMLVPRFGTTVGNGHAQVVDFTNLFQLKLPATGVFSGEPYANVNLGVGNGSKKLFSLPSRNIKAGSLVVKKNGVIVSNYVIKNKGACIGYKLSNIPAYGSGRSVSLNADGTVLAIGSVQTEPYLKIWEWSGSAWTERPQPPNVPADGYSVSLNADGTVLALGSISTEPYLKIWDWTGSDWTERTQPSNVPATGYSVSLNADGSILALGSSYAPYLKIWKWSGSVWTERPQPSNVPASGNSVSLNSDGTVLALGSGITGPYLKIWEWSGSDWTERPQPPNVPTNGTSVSLNADGTVLALGSDNNAPYLKIWEWSGSAWTARTQPPSIPATGYSVSLNADGTVLALGSFNAPYLKIWEWSSSVWTARPQPLSIPNRGNSVSLSADGSILALGSSITPHLKVYTTKEAYSTDVLFDTAPAISDVITADYIVNGIHKTNQRVVDVSFAIQFGEGI